MKKFQSVNLFATLTALCLFAATFLTAQNQPDYQLHFKNQTFTPVENVVDFAASPAITEDQLFENQFFAIIQFYQIPTDSERQNLSAGGILLLDYIPHYGYFAAFQSGFVSIALTTGNIRSIVSVTDAIKLAPSLFTHEFPEHSLREDGKIELLLSYFSNLDPEKVLAALTNQGYDVKDRNDFSKYVHIITPIEDISMLSQLPFVVYLEPVYPTPVPDNYTGRTLHRSNTVANDFSTGRHYDGSGVNVMLQDDGVIGPHIDYEGRVLAQYMGNNIGDHGDHCAGIIMGGGNIDPTTRGNAFGANLYNYSASNYAGFNNIPAHYGSNQIRVSSTSYSDGCNAGYTTLTRTMDQQMRLYTRLLHVFSAGNAGADNCGYGAGAGWGNITGGHKAAKNVIAVANLNSTDGLSSSSSRGPAHDGRIKPEISAKGTSVYSTINPNNYGFKTGTSMSCPGVAGVITQLFQAHRELNGGADPTGGMMKALVMNTADDLGNPGPDFRYGFGRINGLRAVQVLEEGRYDSATIANGQTIEHQFIVPENTAEMRVMVYWVDFESTVNTNWALVNNLDIKVTDPSSSEWLPWVLSHYPNPDSLNKTAVRGIDVRNNQEQVTLTSPEPGQYTLSVTGSTVPQGPQTYYVIYDFIPDEIVLTYPYGGEKLVPGAEEMIRWDAPGTEGIFVLEYSLDNGDTWQMIRNDIAGNVRYYNWIVPSTMTGEAWVRISRGESVSQTNAPLTIVPVPTGLSVDWACENDLHLSWNEVYGASGYTIYKLGQKYMDPIGTTSTNSFIVQGVSASQIHWFSVSAHAPDGSVGQRAIAIQKTAGTLNCYGTDAMMLDVPSVTWGLFQSCMELTSLGVTIKVKNFGLEPVIDPDFSYQLNEGDIFTETYTGTIMPDSILTYTFAGNIDISQVGSYVLKSWIVYAPDQNPGNNELITNFEVIEGVSMAPGNLQTMEEFELCLPAPICELYTCNLADGWINLTNQVLDDVDWRTWRGGTYSFETGPSADHTTGDPLGQYLYLEPSVGCYFKEAVLSLPCIDLTNGQSPALSLWYHAYGSDMGRLHVDLFDGTQIIRDIVPPVVGNQGDEWHELIVDLAPWNGSVIGLRIRGYTGSGEKSDMAIDDIAITDITSVDNIRSTETQVQVYPNPGKGMFNVSLLEIPAGDYQLTVTDISGKTVHSDNVKVSDNQFTKSLNLTKLTSGVYLLEVKSGTKSYQTKLQIR
ncbi:MAG: S8 family serine peptidase [Bacteroidales bacterium]|nr:S8 family serine peptidase [Bacteroidales bacterium]